MRGNWACGPAFLPAGSSTDHAGLPARTTETNCFTPAQTRPNLYKRTQKRARRTSPGSYPINRGLMSLVQVEARLDHGPPFRRAVVAHRVPAHPLRVP